MFDVIVVGAGPSGSSAARRCGQLGLNTLLLDKAIFPREKLCGGALSEYAISLLDFDLPKKLVEREIFGARVHFGKSFVEVKKNYRLAVLVSRSLFDHFLLQKAQEAGVKVIQGERVSALAPHPDFIEIIAGKEKHAGRVVIGCDGFNSVVARYVRRRRDRKDEFGNCIEVSIPAENDVINRYIQNAIDIHLGIVRGGYGWVFPHAGYFSIGIGGEARYLPNPKTVMREFLSTTGFSTAVKMQGYPIPAGGVRRKIVADRIILAGDAAGFVDTFSGEGIGYAIRSGQVAAETASNAIKHGNCTAQGMSSYPARCKREFGISLWYSLYLSRLLHSFSGFFLKLLFSHSEAIEKYIEIPGRHRSYEEYFLWLLPRLPYYILSMIFRRKRSS